MCMPQRLPWRGLDASAKPMCSFDKVLNRVDWVAWASIQIYGTLDDARVDNLPRRRLRTINIPKPLAHAAKM